MEANGKPLTLCAVLAQMSTRVSSRSIGKMTLIHCGRSTAFVAQLAVWLTMAPLHVCIGDVVELAHVTFSTTRRSPDDIETKFSDIMTWVKT
jgi:hypothetical protein